MAILCQASYEEGATTILYGVGLKQGESPNPKCETLLLLEDEDIVYSLWKHKVGKIQIYL